MKLIEIILIGISLSMDAFAVSICKGLTSKHNNLKKIVVISLYFAVFQAVMPLIGYLLGSSFTSIVEQLDHWIAFISLGLIGLNMIKESFTEEESLDADISFKAMLPLSIATSIDALVVGVTFAFFKVNILKAVTIIGLTTFIICAIGVMISHLIGKRLGNKANLIGGIVLIILGTKTLIEHLFF